MRRIVYLACLLILFAVGAAGPAQPGQDQVQVALGKAQIFGVDNRTAIADTTTYPFSAVGQILAYYGTEIHSGTGAMIGNNTVITAAHIVYDQTLGYPDSMDFIPARNGTDKPFGTITVIASSVPQQWIQSGNENFDIGVLTIATAIADETGTLPYGVVSDSTLAGHTLQSAGYPSDLDNGNSMYSAPGPYLGIEGNMLLEEIDTEPGQSGSPIWLQEGGDITVVATLIGTRQTIDSTGHATIQGVGCYISPDILGWIQGTIHGDAVNQPGTTVVMGEQCGTCGAGLGQAFLAIMLGYAACFISRRRPI